MVGTTFSACACLGGETHQSKDTRSGPGEDRHRAKGTGASEKGTFVYVCRVASIPVPHGANTIQTSKQTYIHMYTHTYIEFKKNHSQHAFKFEPIDFGRVLGDHAHEPWIVQRDLTGSRCFQGTTLRQPKQRSTLVPGVLEDCYHRWR